MAKKGHSFGSFAEAAAALKKIFLKTTVAPTQPTNPSTKSKSKHSNAFADMEIAMLQKAEANNSPQKAKRQEFKVQPADRGRPTVAPVESISPSTDQLKAGLLPKRPKTEREALKPMPITSSPPNIKNHRGEQQTKKEMAKRQLLNEVDPKQTSTRKPASVSSPASQVPSSSPPPTAKQLLESIRSLFNAAPPPIEIRPNAVDQRLRKDVEDCIALGAEIIRNQPEPVEPGYIIGCDFGTSSIKIAVRQPYRAGNPTAARPAPDALQSNTHPYLWQSVLWFSPTTEQFSLLPEKDSVALEGFKAGILAEGGGQRIFPELAITRNEAAAAFLALQLAHCIGWYQKTLPLGPDAAKNFLAINIGIPVAAQDDSRTYRDFRHIVSTARALMPHASRLTQSLVRGCYQASAHDLPNGFDLVPELTAAISGYANEAIARDGAHILIDVGASTLDVVAFNLVNRERVAAFAAEVQLLGAAGLDAAQMLNLQNDLFLGACVTQYLRVFNFARHPNVAPLNFDAALRRNPVQLITVGGGCNTDLHQDFIARVNGLLGSPNIVKPCPPANMTEKDCDTSRLLLAYGLTSDIPEQLELRRPSEIPPINIQQSSPINFISKDVV